LPLYSSFLAFFFVKQDDQDEEEDKDENEKRERDFNLIK
jgi:hypothetical protein